MTELEIVETIRTERNALSKRLGDRRSLAAEWDSLTAAQLQKLEEGLRHFPKSARLWILRGDLIQLGGEDPRYSLDDALASYRMALEVDPTSADAHESVGHFLDAVANEPAEAEPYFRKAIELGGGKTASDGLAQVLEQLEHTR